MRHLFSGLGFLPRDGRTDPAFRLLLSGLVHSVGLAILLLLLLPAQAAHGVWASLAGFATLTALAFRGMMRSYPHDRLGLCNLVTQFRAALICTLLAPLALPAITGDPAILWMFVAVSLVALALDGVDGWLARRDGLVSDFGARFDMEVDAAFALLLSLLVWQMETLGAWVLLLGVMRYVFLLAGLIFPVLNEPLPESVRRKWVCVLQLLALIAVLAPPVSGTWASLVAAGALGALSWSFAVDLIWLLRNRQAA